MHLGIELQPFRGRSIQCNPSELLIFNRYERNFDKTSDVTGKIIVNVEPADYTETVKKELKKIAATHVIPGFRKGHVPMDQLRRRFGKQVKSDVINDVVYREVFKYIQDNNSTSSASPFPST